ncbi:hypothetical protein KIW84_073724 [Lathyrus oleraceus]|uniref:DUF7745 domain-containing protein n=1 Tax=Pisum sativum TaxID=3888 RepID=A0A9D4VPF6_PEA|nr:hypothetical protein KIW84_073724 [Pisum sativum]
MDKQRRNTKKYSFRQPNLRELRCLTSYVLEPLEFKGRHGKLLAILSTKILPTLEEYAYHVGIHVLDRLSFSGLEKILSSQEIADMLQMEVSDIVANTTTKGGIQGLPSDFLIAKATLFGKVMSKEAFEAIFVLLIYGLVLFPNIENFVDVNAIRIFSSLNLFSNVPLLGTCGGINYNPALARHQLGFPLKDKPNNISLEGLFFKEGKDPQNLKDRMVLAWCKVHRKGRNELGSKNCVALEPYTSWVRKRALEYRMSYEYPRPTPMVMVGPSTLPNQGVEELRDEDCSRAWVIDEPDDVVTSLLPHSSRFWKKRYDQLAKEKADMEAAYEREVKRLRATYLPILKAFDDYF